MREIIGKTRYGNHIEIEWNISDSKMEILSISEFSDPREVFDRSCVLAAIGMAAKRSKYHLAAERLYEIAIALKYSDSQMDEALREELTSELGLTTSIDRVNYGRSLVGVEYR